MNQENLKKYIRQLPKAELHLHIEGSLEPELMFSLAKRNKLQLKYKSVDEVRAAYEFSDLQSFLDIYYEGAQVLITEQDFYDLTMAYLERVHQDNVCHVEIFFDPQTHLERGIAFATFFNGISKALKDGHERLGISYEMIMCFLRHLSEDEAFSTLEHALPFLDKIIAVGLDSSEKGHPPAKFERVFNKARELGLKTVAHAGEEGPADYITQALDLLKVSRIDHGVRCLEDQLVVDRLVREQIPLTVCPLSNVKLRVFENLKSHNLKSLLAQGLLVTLNSDDPAYFGGYLNTNYIETALALNLEPKTLALLAKNSFKASFLSKDLVDAHCQAIDNIEV